METLHKLLERQLKHFGLEWNTTPSDPKAWQDLLVRIGKAYEESDLERYTHERSMDISSHELIELNRKLENAQHIAKLGYWQYNSETNQMFLSKELRYMFGLEAGQSSNFEQVLGRVHDEDRPRYNQLVMQAVQEGISYEHELRFLVAPEEYCWFLSIGSPVVTDDGPPYIVNGIIIDISRQKEAEKNIAELNELLVTSARRAGMADIATSILHNAGNVLNSAGVSIDIVREVTNSANIKKLFDISNLLKEHPDDMPNYLSQDPKGKIIPKYLITLSEYIEKDYQTLKNEIGNLEKSIQHVKDIVAAQNDISGTGGLVEKVLPSNVIDTAIQMTSNAKGSSEVEIIKNYVWNSNIFIDKSKLIQILVNLIVNAKDALLADTSNHNKKIYISVEEDQQAQAIKIIIKDNGIGIEPENLIKIFSFGFTTKENGHGFGLHSSALSAKEMGGKLIAESDGNEHGAVLTLTLPNKQVASIPNNTEVKMHGTR